jgi:amidase
MIQIWPLIITQTSGGSSAGSGVGVSAGFIPFSIGTETGGSLVYPASKAGLYAMRPSLGSVSAKGCFRISRSFDGVGAMAKTPGDLGPLIEAILTIEAKGKVPDGGFGAVMKGGSGWEGMRVGFVGQWSRREVGRGSCCECSFGKLGWMKLMEAEI